MAKRKEKTDEYKQPHVPLKRGQFRNPNYVRPIVVRMGKPFVKKLDILCKTNKRSRREIIELLINKAAFDLHQDPADRIVPL